MKLLAMLRELDKRWDDIAPAAAWVRTKMDGGANFPPVLMKLAFHRDDLLIMRGEIRKAIENEVRRQEAAIHGGGDQAQEVHRLSEPSPLPVAVLRKR